MNKLRIGLVCPYGWDVPGGVQNHVRDLAEFFISEGHFVSVLAPVVDESDLPDYLVNAGKPIGIPFNGAVARVLFNPAAFARVRHWLAENEFDILHLHEPAIPSISLLALWASEGPIVGTFHAQAKKGTTTRVIASIVEPAIERLTEKIAVSQAAYNTLLEHMDTTAHVIPNGIFADRYRNGSIEEKWTGPTLGFIGRFEEPRKGLEVLIDAIPIISRFIPDVRVLIAGPGDPSEISDDINSELRSRFHFLGKISENEKADFLKSIALYIAPNTGGESFGIIIAEAMAGGAAVVASDIQAFQDLLGAGEYGALFASEDSQSLAKVVIDLLRDDQKRRALAQAGRDYAQRFDWSHVANQIYEIYEKALATGETLKVTAESRAWDWLLIREND
ncbi:MAG: glycosyltransferase family 4 protein [Candidatus Planktophila sp.]